MSDAHRDEIAKLETRYAEHPEGRIFTHLAEACRKAGDLDRAREVLTDGIERHPDYSSAHVVLGRVLMDLDQHDEAETEFRRVLELDPHNLVAVRSLGDIARAQGREEDALEHYERLLDLEPSDDVRDIIASMTSDLVVPGPAEEVGEAGEPGEGMADAPGDDVADEGGEAVADDGGEAVPMEGSEEWDAPSAAEPTEPAPLAAESEAEQWATADPDSDWAGVGEPERAEVEEPVEAEGGEGEDVMTETIAQVYARQGLYDRAAEVYRELVRARPGDEGLRERLAEMEEKAAAGVPGLETESTEAGLPGLEPEPEGEPEPGAAHDEPAPAEGFYSAELDADDVEADPLPGFEPEALVDEAPVDEAPVDEALVNEALVGEAPVDEAPVDEALVDEAPVDEAPVDEAPADEAPADDLSWLDEPEPAGSEDPVEVGAEDVGVEEASELEASELEAAEEAADGVDEPDWLEELAAESDAGEDEMSAEVVGEAEEPASPWTGEDWSEPDAEAETPYTWAAEEEAADTSPPIGEYLSGLLEWAGDGAPSGGAPEPPDPPGQGPVREAESGAGPSAEPAEAGDDDDLDMFRSWLESLKQ